MEILQQNEDFTVCIKPVGIDSQQGMCALLQEQLGGEFYPLHRLDQNVGGVMIYARNKKAAADLSFIISRQEMVKEYVAMVRGTPPSRATWEDLLFKDSSKNKVFVVKKLRKGVKAAKLSFACLKAGEQSLVQVRLYTGRSHQIRVQFASRKTPVFGDGKYGSRTNEKTCALWSYSVSVPHPLTSKTLSFSSLPDSVFPWNTFNYEELDLQKQNL
jgi:23S rRNA pseudouridine1911/1915/1917 synthase